MFSRKGVNEMSQEPETVIKEEGGGGEVSEIIHSSENSLFVDRIYQLAGEKNVTIGELEDIAGVSKGYLSRLKKNEDPEGTIGAKALFAIAEKLEVPIELLFNTNQDTLTKTEVKVITFIQMLRNSTIDGTLEWIRDDFSWLSYLQGLGIESVDDDDEHPLFLFIEKHDVIAYVSSFYKEAIIKPAGNFYHAWLAGQNTNIYITKIEKSEVKKKNIVYEVYLIDNPTEEVVYTKPMPICNTELSKPIFGDIVKSLYLAAEEASSHIVLDQRADSIISSFIENQEKEGL